MSTQVLAAQGVSEDELDAELAERLAEAERQAVSDEGVSTVLLLSAQAELGALRSSANTAAASPAPAAEAEVRAARPQACRPFST
jgi:LDH2 family malate/lactate/ureidoglycolate dehydrogenase